MHRYVINRILLMIPTLLGVALITFVLLRMVPGDYKAFAWMDIEPGAWQDPEVLQRYENQGQPVSVTSGSKLNIDVRLVR